MDILLDLLYILLKYLDFFHVQSSGVQSLSHFVMLWENVQKVYETMCIKIYETR